MGRLNQKKIRFAKLSAGQVAKRSGVKISTLHFYEAQQLIHAVRNAGNQRRYFNDVLRRIAVIKAAQKIGIKLNDIKTAMSFLPTDKAPTKRDWEQLSKGWQEQLTQKIRNLTVLRENLTSCIGCGCLSLKACPLYNPNDELGINKTGAVLLENSNLI